MRKVTKPELERLRAILTGRNDYLEGPPFPSVAEFARYLSRLEGSGDSASRIDSLFSQVIQVLRGHRGLSPLMQGRIQKALEVRTREAFPDADPLAISHFLDLADETMRAARETSRSASQASGALQQLLEYEAASSDVWLSCPGEAALLRLQKSPMRSVMLARLGLSMDTGFEESSAPPCSYTICFRDLSRAEDFWTALAQEAIARAATKESPERIALDELNSKFQALEDAHSIRLFVLGMRNVIFPIAVYSKGAGNPIGFHTYFGPEGEPVVVEIPVHTMRLWRKDFYIPLFRQPNAELSPVTWKAFGAAILRKLRST